MSRIVLSTDYKTRTGAPDKDARLTNAYVEVRGDKSVVRKRPIAQGGVSIGTGTAQGGIGLNIAGTDYIYTVNGDTGALDTLATAGTSWSSGASYNIGDHVVYGFADYWALTDNSNSNPASNPSDWSSVYVPAVPPVYHNGTSQNTNGGTGWSTLFGSFNASNICQDIGKVPVDDGRTSATPPYPPLIDWYTSLGAFNSEISVPYVSYPTNGLLEYGIIGAISMDDGFYIITMKQGSAIVRVLKVTPSSYSIHAEFSADSAPNGTVMFSIAINGDNHGNIYIYEATYIITTRKVDSTGTTTDTGQAGLPPWGIEE